MAKDKEDIKFAKTFIEGEFHLGLWSYIKKGVSVLDSFFILRSLSLYQFGVYQLLLTLYAFLSDVFHDLFAGVISNDIVRFVGEGKESYAKKLFLEYAVFRILMTVPPFIYTFFIAPHSWVRYGQDAITWVRILSVLFIVDTLLNLAMLLLNLRLEFRILAIRPTLQKVIQFSLLAYFFFFQHLDLTRIFLAQVLAPIFLLLLFIPALIRSFRPWRKLKTARELKIFKIIFSYGVWEVPQLILRDFLARVRPFLIKLFLNTEAVGIFGIANTALSMLKDLLPTRTLNALMPRKAHDENYLNYLLYYGTKYYVLMALGAAAIGAVAFPLGVHYIFPQFEPSIPLFYILLPSLFIFAFTKIMNLLQLVYRKQNMIFYQSFAKNAIGTLALVVFIPLGGLYGISLGTEVGELVSTYLWYYILLRIKFIEPLRIKTFFQITDEDRRIVGLVRTHLVAMLPWKRNA
ncbi:oligosaccharide flippase family protein [Candidatus Parcubacteria bacterium]|nr:oligosaccharide flippase family protein [Candidatus Parcubacteria bacterium]